MNYPIDLITGILDYFFFPYMMSAGIWIAVMISIAVLFIVCLSLVPKVKNEAMKTILYPVITAVHVIVFIAVVDYPFNFITEHLTDCMDTRVIVKYNLDEIALPARECRFRKDATAEWGEWDLVEIY